MAKLVATVGLAFILTSTLASADPVSKPNSKPSDNPSQKYCVTFDVSTGSHLVRTECHTKSQWRQLGVDIDDLLKK
jgi:hypothetical protein